MSRLRVATILYGLLSVTMIGTSLYTGHRATDISGRQHYMLTTTHIFVDEEVAPQNAGDAAFDAAMRAEGESTKLPVKKPLFVLGFADATGPFVLGGGGVLAAAWLWKRRKGRHRAISPPTSPEL